MGNRDASWRGWTWLRENPVLQPVHRIFVGLLVVWSASGSTAILAALAICVASPILGWSIAPPLLLTIALKGAFLWIVGVFAIFGSWTVTGAIVGFASVTVHPHR
jgi:hypothetical protein